MHQRPTINRTPIHHPEGGHLDSAEVLRRLDVAIAQVQTTAVPTINVAPSPTMEGPYLDYARTLTPEGGILLTYKDIDDDPIHFFWHIFLWIAATGGEIWFLLHVSLAHAQWANIAAMIVLGGINVVIVNSQVEIYRTLEIRPDCMILDRQDLFWAVQMENGGPQFRRDEEGNLKLVGVYGTRLVEFLTVRRFDENDRMPEVFAAHLKDAMRQLWPPFS